MSEIPNDSPPTSAGGRGNKLTQFIKKNKTLTAVIAAGGIYYIIKSQGASEGGGESSGGGGGEGPEYSENTPSNEIGSVNSRQEYNELIAEEEERRSEGKTREREEEVEQKEFERENEERDTVRPSEEGAEAPEPGTPAETPTSPAEPGASTSEHGVSIHGKDFPGATSSRIAGTGKTGNKAYIEYVITYPGRQEHWQYFTASGNWKQANNSAAGATANKPSHSPAGGTKPKTGTGSGATSPAKGGGNKRPVHSPVSVSPAKPVSAPAQNASGGVPQNNAQHPAAVNTGNLCVNGGVGGHTAPAGYHLFCQGGYIWRAPNG